MSLKKCLWNSPELLQVQAKHLKANGYDEAAQGCLDRISKLEHLFKKYGSDPKNTRPFEEPVDLR